MIGFSRRSCFVSFLHWCKFGELLWHWSSLYNMSLSKSTAFNPQLGTQCNAWVENLCSFYLCSSKFCDFRRWTGIRFALCLHVICILKGSRSNSFCLDALSIAMIVVFRPQKYANLPNFGSSAKEWIRTQIVDNFDYTSAGMHFGVLGHMISKCIGSSKLGILLRLYTNLLVGNRDIVVLSQNL